MLTALAICNNVTPVRPAFDASSSIQS
jgi:phospholipid-translocating ATPase